MTTQTADLFLLDDLEDAGRTSFRPFQSPVPFVFVRQSVISDWKFFLDKPDWFNHWAQRFGLSAVHALAAELRRLPWRRRDEGGT
jgi:hypothetical protein